MDVNNADYWKSKPPCHVDSYFADAEARVLRDLAGRCDRTRCLDIGCGDPERGRKILEGYEHLDSVDPHPRVEGVLRGDAGEYDASPYNTVLAGRVLCNIPIARRQVSIQNLARLTAPGGRLLLADGDWHVRENTKLYRAEHDYDPLPDSSSGSVELRSHDLWELYYAGFKCIERRYVAPDYIIWTRRDQPTLLSLDDPRRFEYPKYTEAEHEEFAWARVWLLERVPE